MEIFIRQIDSNLLVPNPMIFTRNTSEQIEYAAFLASRSPQAKIRDAHISYTLMKNEQLPLLNQFTALFPLMKLCYQDLQLDLNIPYFDWREQAPIPLDYTARDTITLAGKIAQANNRRIESADLLHALAGRKGYFGKLLHNFGIPQDLFTQPVAPLSPQTSMA